MQQEIEEGVFTGHADRALLILALRALERAAMGPPTQIQAPGATE